MSRMAVAMGKSEMRVCSIISPREQTCHVDNTLLAISHGLNHTSLASLSLASLTYAVQYLTMPGSQLLREPLADVAFAPLLHEQSPLSE